MIRNEKKVPIRQRKLKTLSSSFGTPKSIPKSHQNYQNQDQEIIKDSEQYCKILLKKIYFPKSTSNDYKEILPNLTTSDKIDIQLYAFLGLLFKNFIYRWYYRLSDSPEFMNEIIIIVSKLMKNLETRLREIDLLEFILDDIPIVLNHHMETYKQVQLQTSSVFLPFDDTSQGFDSIDKHLGLDHDDPESEAKYLRILSKNILKNLLPPEEQESELVMEFMKGLLGDLVLRIVMEKLVQPYQIMEIISIVCEVALKERGNKKDQKEEETPPPVETTQPKTLMERVQGIITQILNLVAQTSKPKSNTQFKTLDISNLSIFTFLSNLFQITHTKPIFYSMISSASLLVSTTPINSSINNFLQNSAQKSLNEDLISGIIQKLRNILFPTDDEMGPSRIEPASEEYIKIKQTTRENLIKLLKKFGVWDVIVNHEDLDSFLNGFENKRINKHLILRLVDLIVVRIIPEMTESNTQKD